MEVLYSTIIATLTLLFAVIKYFHEKKEARRNVEFDQFRQIIDRVAGRYPDGRLMVDVQQIAAVYQLLHFRRYKHISLPVLQHILIKLKDDNAQSLLEAVENVYNELL